MPDLSKKRAHPWSACTAAELARLRSAYRSKGPARRVVAAVVRRADTALRENPVFPPRGGQHNQWYQCGRCQIGLKTVDPTHHKCAQCGRVYTGEPYDDVLYGRQHGRNLSRMRDAAWAYALTGDKKYAGYARGILLGYSGRYLRYPYHDSRCRRGNQASRSGGRLFEQTLNEASAMTQTIAPAYDLIHDSGVLSPEDHAAICGKLIGPMLKNIAGYKAGKSNWQTWHNAALFAGGVMVGDDDLVRRSIRDPANGFRYQMRVSVSKEGMWYENSWGYHFYTLSALVHHAEYARRAGTNLWRSKPLQKMLLLPVHYTMADGSLPRFGDDVASSLRTRRDVLEAAWHAYRAPGLLGLLPADASWHSVLYGRDLRQVAEPPRLTSRVFPHAGHAILRSTGRAGLTAAMTFGPYGGFHGHLDKLSFVFFGHGRELGVDPGRARSQAYRLPIHRGWYKATLSHNAVLVDQSSQAPAAGKLLGFAATDRYAAAAAVCDRAYKGVSHRRLLCLTPAYLLVVDDLASGAEHRYDWVYHNRGRGVTCRVADKKGRGGKPYPGRQYLHGERMGRTDGLVRAVFRGPRLGTQLVVGAAPDTEVRTADGPGESVADRVPLAMISRWGKTVRFAVAIEPVLEGRKPAVKHVALVLEGKELVVTVQRGRTADTVTWDRKGRFVVAHGKDEVLSSRPGPAME